VNVLASFAPAEVTSLTLGLPNLVLAGTLHLIQVALQET
jgi:hypothetical protein